MIHGQAWSAVGLVCGVLMVSGAHAAPPDHIVIVVEENHNYNQIIGSPSAPYINWLAQNGTSLTSMYAVTRGSQVDMLHLFSGANQGVTDSNVPVGAPFSTPNLGAALRAAGRTFVGYSEGLPAVGSLLEVSGAYVRKHSPWTNWQSNVPNANQLPASVNQPFTAFPSDFTQLPTVCFVIPDLNHDMHDGTILQADSWLQSNLSTYATWAMTHNSLLIVTWDEDGDTERNRIPTIFYGPMVKTGQVASVRTLHDLLRTVEDLYGIAHSGAAASVSSITGVFTTDPPTTTISFRNGVGGYTSSFSTYIESDSPNTAHGFDAWAVTDASPLRHALVRFDNLFGDVAVRIPTRADILSAKLALLTGPTSGDAADTTVSVHRLLTPFSTGSTWNSLVGGINLGTDAVSAPEFTILPESLDAWMVFDVTQSLRTWKAGTASNLGWALMPNGTDAWRFASVNGVVGDRPLLQVTYTIPRCGPMDIVGQGGSAGYDGALTVDDLVAYLAYFFAGNPIADITALGGTDVPDGQITVDDLVAALRLFFSGCP